jgi:hypothetical protein
MKRLLLVLPLLALPLLATAGDAKPASKTAPRRPAPAASAPAPAAAASAIDSRKVVLASKQRSIAMGACQRQAVDRNLNGEERRQFVLTCLAGG